jgi:hypothetical protein
LLQIGFQMPERRPADIIGELFQERESWSNDQILSELASLRVLPDEYLYLERSWFGPDNPAWDDPLVVQQALLYLTLAGLVEERKLRQGVPLLLERASYGDMGEAMRGLHIHLSGAYDPDWPALADVCIRAAEYPQPGCRLWAIDLLGRLNAWKLIEVRGLPILFEALDDPAKLVRFHACRSLELLCKWHPEYKDEVSKALQQLIVASRETLEHAQTALKEIVKEK